MNRKEHLMTANIMIMFDLTDEDLIKLQQAQSTLTIIKDEISKTGVSCENVKATLTDTINLLAKIAMGDVID